MNFDSERLRRLRAERAWTQEQLAHCSGVSARTIQRLERGRPPSSETQQALAAAFGITADQLSQGETPPFANSSVRRVTPILVIDDIRPLVEQYRMAGFGLVETEDAGCVGLRAGSSFLVVATARFMRGDYRESTVAMMLGRATPYLYVRSAEATRSHFSGAQLIETVSTCAGTLELVLENETGLFILAEKNRSDAAPNP